MRTIELIARRLLLYNFYEVEYVLIISYVQNGAKILYPIKFQSRIICP